MSPEIATSKKSTKITLIAICGQQYTVVLVYLWLKKEEVFFNSTISCSKGDFPIGHPLK